MKQLFKWRINKSVIIYYTIYNFILSGKVYTIENILIVSQLMRFLCLLENIGHKNFI